MTSSSALKYQHIAAELREGIRSGRYAPGSPLPSLSALMETYGVALDTAKKGVRLLIDEGLAWSEQGRGTFVSDPLPEEARSETERMRADIEALAAKVRELEDRLTAHEERGHQ